MRCGLTLAPGREKQKKVRGLTRFEPCVPSPGLVNLAPQSGNGICFVEKHASWRLMLLAGPGMTFPLGI